MRGDGEALMRLAAAVMSKLPAGWWPLMVVRCDILLPGQAIVSITMILSGLAGSVMQSDGAQLAAAVDRSCGPRGLAGCSAASFALTAPLSCAARSAARERWRPRLRPMLNQTHRILFV